MMHSMMNGRMKGWIDARVPSALGSSPESVDGAVALVEKIRALADRRLAAFWLSPVGRRRLLLRIHAEAAAFSAEPERKAPRHRR